MRLALVRQCFIGFFVSILLCVNALAFAAAADSQPVVVLKQSAQQMVSMLKANHARLHNQKFLHAQVRAIVLPRFDLQTMARSIVGRNYWASATAAQRAAFIREFTSLVISVYAAPLADFNGDQIQFLPQRENAGTRSVVRTQIIRPTGQKISVVYQMLKAGETWKVYDFSIEGISMVSSYRAQFAGVLQQKGLNGLLTDMQQHNRSV
ncbi:MAG: ABC transporter substrate-binding protein [Pseudomonadota bacterium]|nr:ABC transporter substrate-binding protein [Pseudomonadota bacterium]